MYYDATRNDHGLPLDPFKALVAPRPIAWISTLSQTGVANLAPYSFFNAFSEQPHYLAFGSSGRKDSLRNIEASGEFAINLVTLELREAMNASSATAAPEVSEFGIAGVTAAACRAIAAPRVSESPAAFECRLHDILPLPDDDGRPASYLVLGRVVGIHIDDAFIEDGRVNTARLQLIARLGYAEYATITAAWRMRRPD
jgi:flavin reductase (DIM6/NTAB) family NADH-FMN oxidoreductase RutF